MCYLIHLLSSFDVFRFCLSFLCYLWLYSSSRVMKIRALRMFEEIYIALDWDFFTKLFI